ncbi:hypothetical protein AB0N65_02905 [Paenarthrobacter sp. NPDC089322]
MEKELLIWCRQRDGDLAVDLERFSPANFIEELPNPSTLEAGCAFGCL